MRESKWQLWTLWAVVAVFALTHGVVFQIFPTVGDDIWYGFRMYDWIWRGKGTFPLDGIVTTDVWHCVNDSARLSNVLIPWFLVMPKWLVSALSAATVLAWVAMMYRIAEIGRRNLALCALGLVMVAVLMPWYDNMAVLAYRINYVWPSWALLLYGWLFARSCSGARVSPWTLLLGLVLGFWHEGFTVPLIAAMSGTLVLRWRRPSWIQLAMIAALLPGVMFFVLTPALTQRSGFLHFDAIALNLFKILRMHLAFWLFAALYIYCVVRRRDLRVWRDQWLTLVILASLATIAVHTTYPTCDRPGWLAHLYCSVGSLRLLRRILPERLVANTRLSLGLAAAMLALLAVHAWAVVSDTIKIRRQCDAFMAEFVTDGEGPIFLDEMTIQPRLNPLGLCKPSPEAPVVLQSSTFMQRQYLNVALKREGKRYRPAIPVSLRYVTAEHGRQLQGSEGIRVTDDGYYFAKARDGVEPCQWDAWWVMADYGYIRKLSWVVLSSFRSQADSAVYWFAFPFQSTIPFRYTPIVGIDSLANRYDMHSIPPAN